MIDLGPPPLVFPTPQIIRPVEGGLWGSLDREMARLGLRPGQRRAVIIELKRTIGTRDQAIAARSVGDWTKLPLLGASLASKLRAAAGTSGSGRDPLSVTYCTTAYTGNSTNSSWTYNTQSISTASATRVVFVIAATAQTGSNVLSLTINGIAATKIFSDVNFADSQADCIAAFALLVTSGTTANFVLSTSPNANAPMLAIYAVDAGDTALPTVEDYAVGSVSNGAGTITLSNVDVSAGGAIIGGGHGVSGTPFGGTWSVLTQNLSVYSYVGSFNTAHAEYASAGTYSPTVSVTNGNYGSSMAAVALAIR